MGTAPVVLIGMHRSGTSLMTQLLKCNGLFVGANLDTNYEPIYFANLNNWLMRQCSAEWDYPKNFNYLFENRELLEWMVKRLSYLVSSPRTIFYLGLPNYLRWRSPFNINRPWGWKDPRNTYTLPLWLRLFPEAKVLHIYRHGVDVAQSLKMRAERELAKSACKVSKIEWMRLRPIMATSTIRCLTIEGGFSLWEEYMAEAKKHVSSLGSQALEVQYESLLRNPAAELEKVIRFCKLPAKKNKINNTQNNLVKENAYRYRTNQDLLSYADQMANRLKKYGYSK